MKRDVNDCGQVCRNAGEMGRKKNQQLSDCISMNTSQRNPCKQNAYESHLKNRISAMWDNMNEMSEKSVCNAIPRCYNGGERNSVKPSH